MPKITVPAFNPSTDAEMKETNKGESVESEKQTLTLAAASALTSLCSNSPSPTENVTQEKCGEGSDNDRSIGEDQGCVDKKYDDDDDIPMTFPQRVSLSVLSVGKIRLYLLNLTFSLLKNYSQLMEILSDETHSEIITWLPHGKAFIIYQKKKFANEVLPRYFKQSKYTSFTRKLNRWGFIRVTRGPETGAYYHNVSVVYFSF